MLTAGRARWHSGSRGDAMTTTLRATIPGPAGHPILGMGPAFRRDPLCCMLDGFREYGDLVAYPFGPRRGPLRRVAVAAYHPDYVHQVLTTTGPAFGRQTVGFSTLAEVLGRGLLTTEGEVWRRQRRTLQPLFTRRRVAGYTELMCAEAEWAVAEGAGGAAVDLHALMQRYALRVVGRALFGEDIEEIIGELQPLVPALSDLVMQRTTQVMRMPLDWPTLRNRRLSRLRDTEYALVDRILAERADPAAVSSDDLLSRLYAARDPDTGLPLSAQEIRDQVLVFLMAGHETTAGALTFTLYLLGRDPEIAGYLVPRGTAVFLSSWVTHRHPVFWPEPDRFDPQRFLGDQDRPRYAYFPFGGGPRSCIGEHFALLEATVLLQALLSRYRVVALDAELPVAPLVTLRPAAPVRARLSPR